MGNVWCFGDVLYGSIEIFFGEKYFKGSFMD